MATREHTKSRIPILSHSSTPTSPRTPSSTLPKVKSSIPSPRCRYTTTPILKTRRSPKRTVTLKTRPKPNDDDIITKENEAEAAQSPLIVETKIKPEGLEKGDATAAAAVNSEQLPAESNSNVPLIEVSSNDKEITFIGKPISQKEINDVLMGAILPFEQEVKPKNVFTILDSPATQFSDEDEDDDCVLFEKDAEDVHMMMSEGPRLVPFIGLPTMNEDIAKPVPFLFQVQKKESKILGTSCEPAAITQLPCRPTLEEIQNVTPPPLQQSHEDLMSHLLLKKQSLKRLTTLENLDSFIAEHTIHPPAKTSLNRIHEQGNSKSCPLHNAATHQSIEENGSRLKSASVTQNSLQDSKRSEDVNVLFSGTPMNMDSTLSVRELEKPDGPTYLQLHKQKLAEEMTRSKAQKSRIPSLQRMSASSVKFAESEPDNIQKNANLINYGRVEEQTQTSYPSLGYCDVQTSYQAMSESNKDLRESQVYGDGYNKIYEDFEYSEDEFDFEHKSEVMSSIEDTETEDEDNDEEEVLMDFNPRPNVNVNLNTSKKAKGIFSLEYHPSNNLDYSYDSDSLGPRDNGDGYDIHPQKSKVEIEQEFKELFVRNTQSDKVSMKQRSSTGFIPPNESMDSKRIFTKMLSSGDIEILPSSLTPTNLKRSGAMNDLSEIAPVEKKKSSFIMQRDSKVGNVFCRSQRISNLTPQLFAYKVFLDEIGVHHYTVSPKQGFIFPHRDVLVDVKTCSTKHITSKLASKDEIFIKIFPAYCDNESELKNYFNKLSEQRPDLIQTHTIDKMVLWDAGDLVSMKSLLDSIEDEKERKSLKEQLHHEYSQRVLPEVHLKRLLNNVKSEMLVANSSLRSMFNELMYLKNGSYIAINVMLFLTIFSMILPLLQTNVVVEEPKEDPTIWEQFVSFFKIY